MTPWQAVASFGRLTYRNARFRAVFILNLLLGLAHSMTLPFIPLFGTVEARMSNLTFGTFMALNATANVIVGTIMAHYSDARITRRLTMLVGGCAGVIGYIGYAYFRAFVPLLVTGVLVIALATICFSQVFAYAREILLETDAPSSEHPFHMQAMRMFYGLAWIAGPAIGSAIMSSGSFFWLFASVAGVYVVFCVIVALWVPSAPPRAQPASDGSSPSLRQLLIRRDLLVHVLGFVFVMAAIAMNYLAFPLFITTTLHGTEAMVGIAFSIGPIFEIPLMLYFGLLATRHAPESIVRVGVLIAIAYLLGLAFATDIWHVYALQSLRAALTAVLYGTAISYFQIHLPKHLASATNLWVATSMTGTVVGYLLFGIIARFGLRTLFGVCAALAFVGLALLYSPIRRPQE